MNGRNDYPIPTIDNDDDWDGSPPSGIEDHQVINRLWEIGHNQNSAIIIDSSDDDNDDSGSQVRNQQIIAEQDVELEIAESMDIVDDANLGYVAHNRQVENHLLLPRCYHRGMIIKEGTVVEIKQLSESLFSIQFLEIQMIRREGHGIILRGMPFTRARNLNGKLPLKRNEVVAILNIHQDDFREWTTQAAIEVNINDVLCIRELQTTNAIYPTHRYDVNKFKNPKDAEEHAILTCRSKMISFYESAAAEKKQRLHSRTLVRLRAHEVTNPKLRSLDDHLLNTWRGGKIRGGSSSRMTPELQIIDLTDNNSPNHIRRPGQRYTHADMFCGAGGVTRGAKKAGFKTTIACDIDPNACATYRLNFPDTDLHEMSVHELVTSMPDSPVRVDVLHISPPCQVWSPAHTRAGQNDEANLAALYACLEVLVKFRPRIVTVEQTFGLLHDRFRHFFNLFVHCFTTIDYSVTYKIVNLAEIGSSQKRKRLIMIASCPGERLPGFPNPTHNVTVAQVLSTISPRATLHNVDEVLARALRNPTFPRQPYDPNALLQHTITTGGGDYHPSGKRGFTLREFAALQGFPSHHRFAGRSIRKQIGNAFPPTTVKALYDHIHSWLLKEDGIKGEDEGEVIVLDGEEEPNVEDQADIDEDIIIVDPDDDIMIVDWRERSATLEAE